MRARYSPARWLSAAALAVFLVAVLAARPASAQGFGVEVAATRGEAGPALRVYTAVPYAGVQFLARAGGFRARYGLTVQVYAQDGKGRRGALVASRTDEREVAVADYDATQSPDRADRAVQTLAVPPGRYAVAVVVEDGASGRSVTRELAHTVRDLGGPGPVAGDPLLLHDYDPATGTGTPIVGATVSTEDPAFWVACDVFADAPAALRVSYVVTEQAADEGRPSFGALLGLAPRERAEAGTPVAVTETVEVGAGRTPAAFRIATEGLQAGDYTLTVRLADAGGRALGEVSKPFAVRWTGLDGQIADLDQAIAQLRYVAREGEIEAIRGAPTPEAQRRQFLAFWRDRDPTPGTGRNEEMEAFYFRVSAADARWGRSDGRGWSTDRGEVFIRFGEPEAVEEHGATYGTRSYQIWRYPSRGRQFIFADKTGAGDLELVVPIWDPRTQM